MPEVPRLYDYRKCPKRLILRQVVTNWQGRRFEVNGAPNIDRNERFIMENEEAKSKWDDLARELGADVASESSSPKAVSTERDEPSAAQNAATVRDLREKAPPAPAKRPTTDWNALNTELGLEPPPAPEPPKSEPPPRLAQTTTRREETIRRDERSDSKERLPREQEGRARRDEEQSTAPDRRRSDRTRRPSSSREEEQGDEQGRTRGEGRPHERSRSSRPQRDASHRDDARTRRASAETSEPATSRTRQEPRRGRSRRHDERDQGLTAPEQRPNHHVEQRALDEEAATRDEQPIMSEPEPPKPPSVSLWHKIFGLPAEQSAKLSGAAEQEAASRDETESTPSRKETSWSDDTHREVFAADLASEADDLDRPAAHDEFEVANDRGFDAPEDRQVDDSDDQRKRRPRRRRRGGRKSGERHEESREDRKSPRRHDPARETADGPNTADDFDDEFAGSPTRATDSARPDFDLDDDELDEDVHGTGSAPKKSLSHRGIPSWNEAIGAIVDLNLQSRSQRRHSAQSHGHTSAPRGRARGGRRKKKS